MSIHPKHPRRRKKKSQARLKKRVLSWMRGLRSDLTLSHRMIWRTHCGRYRVERIAIQLALDTNPYPPYYLAIFENLILSRHRNRKAAEEACERHTQGIK